MNGEPPPTHLAELPADLTDHVPFLGVVLGQRSQQLFEAAMAPLGLRPVHYDYLACLRTKGPLPQGELARLMEVDAARIVALTDELEERTLVTRTVDPSDRRRKLLELTAPGRRLLGRARRSADTVEAEVLAELDEDEQRTLRRLLRRALGLPGNAG